MEMLIVIVMIGIMSLFAWPKVVVVLDQSQVRAARASVLNRFNSARLVARQSSGRATLIRNGNVFWIERSPRLLPGTGTVDTVGGFLVLGDRFSYGVNVTGAAAVPIDPRGLTPNGNWNFVFSRGAASDSLWIRGYGRVTR